MSYRVIAHGQGKGPVLEMMVLGSPFQDGPAQNWLPAHFGPSWPQKPLCLGRLSFPLALGGPQSLAGP